MAEATPNPFVWYDLMTTDVEGAKSFYSEVIGWKPQRWSGPAEYEMWSMGEKTYGGLMKLPDDAKKMGAPPHWMGYVAVRSVDEWAGRAAKLGGKLLVPGTDIPEVGRFAVLSDPQGATFALFTSKGGGMPSDRGGLGAFSWAELNTTDYQAAWRFYSELFGWKPTQAMDMGPEFGQYFMFGLDAQKSIGGMSNAAKMMKAPAHWLHYVNVKSVDETVKVVQQRGGKVLNGPMEVPGGDRIAQCMDPQGAFFAIYSEGKK